MAADATIFIEEALSHLTMWNLPILLMDYFNADDREFSRFMGWIAGA